MVVQAHHRAALRQGFEIHRPERVSQAGEREQICFGEAPLHFLPRQPSQEHHPIVEAEPSRVPLHPAMATPPSYQKTDILRSDGSCDSQKKRQTFPAHKAAGP
jgi:hypothetical protein